MMRMIAGAALAAAVPVAAPAQTMPPMAGMTHDEAAPDPATPTDHGDMPGMDGMIGMGDAPFAGGSGTARLPAADAMQGLHLSSGDWALMLHGYAWGAWTDQGGPRGDAQAFVQSMAMAEASRPLGDRLRLQLRSMLSLDPLMGRRGYPNLFTVGETAYGVPLVDRQHPHELFMELSGRIDLAIGGEASLFLYGGLPGEPALGPSAFMHRGSARLIPEAPITHHWFDSTHISFGVVTAGYSTPSWQIEASAFNAREPGENRWNIETAPLDSWSVRASVTPGRHWAAQLSYGRLKNPERQHFGDDETRLTASIGYAANGLDLTVGFARKDPAYRRRLDAIFAEGTWAPAPRHALFGRIERVANDELFESRPASLLHDRVFHVARLSAGYAYTVPLGQAASLALGASGSAYAKPHALDIAYGDAPKSVTLFAKLAIGR